MDSRETKRTVPVPSAPTDGEQPNSQTTTQSIAEGTAENNPQEESLEEMLRDMRRKSDPAYLHTVSMNDLYQNVYLSRPPIIDGLLYPGTYLFAGAPKVGKSFLMAQLAYHVSTGQRLWGYEQGCNIDLCGYPHEEEEVLDPLDTIREYQERRTTLNAEIDKVLAELEALLPGGVKE